MMKRSSTNIHSLLLLLLFSLVGIVSCDSASSSSSSSLQDKCSPEFTKLGECLNYASAKADEPTSACCDSVADIRRRNPVCLCFIIQQAHAGGSSVTSLGLQFSRLIQLPAACKLANSNITDCPKLLNLSPSSPDNAIFTNVTKAATTSTPTGSSNGTIKSIGVMHQIHIDSTFAIAVISAILLSIF